jgi:UDP-glucose 4-epimerase
MRVVVTGGAGFIGANLCRTLAANDAVGEVAAFDDLSSGSRDNLEGIKATLIEGSILDAAALDRCFEGASAVVHLAARASVPRSIADPMASHEANATGTAQVLEAARRSGDVHVIVASSSSVYGASPEMPKHEGLAPAPLSPYAASKLATESYTLAWGHSFGMAVLPFRFFNVFGPLQPAGHDYAAVIPAFMGAALAGKPVTVHGDGGQTRDFTYVDSVAAVITDAVVRHVTSPTPVNLAFGGRASLLEVLELLEDILGEPIDRVHVEPRAGDVRDSQADQTRLRSLFHDIEPVPLRAGLERTMDWFRETAAG